MPSIYRCAAKQSIKTLETELETTISPTTLRLIALLSLSFTTGVPQLSFHYHESCGLWHNYCTVVMKSNGIKISKVHCLLSHHNTPSKQ